MFRLLRKLFSGPLIQDEPPRVARPMLTLAECEHELAVEMAKPRHHRDHDLILFLVDMRGHLGTDSGSRMLRPAAPIVPGSAS